MYFIEMICRVAGVDIEPSARKHGVQDGDMLHALRHYWRHVATDDPAVALFIGPSPTADPAVALFIGPSPTAEPLEVAVVSDGTRTAIIHAMRVRRKFL